MKIILSYILFFLFLGTGLSAQQVTKTFSVSGTCGMCKKTIEAAALKQGVSAAAWDKSSQSITVTFDSGAITDASIKQAIADAGYDADGVKAGDSVYNALPDCCKYREEKSGAKAQSSCCAKDGVCNGEKNCCKKKRGSQSCCAKGTCGEENGCCSKCEKSKGQQCHTEGHKDKSCKKKDCCKKKAGCKPESDCKH